LSILQPIPAATTAAATTKAKIPQAGSIKPKLHRGNQIVAEEDTDEELPKQASTKRSYTSISTSTKQTLAKKQKETDAFGDEDDDLLLCILSELSQQSVLEFLSNNPNATLECMGFFYSSSRSRRSLQKYKQ